MTGQPYCSLHDPELDPPDPETVMDGFGVPLRDFEAYMDWAESEPEAGQ